MEVDAKQLIIVGGPNGAGKTTFAEKYISENDALYLAADKIAFELSPANPLDVRIEAAAEFMRRFEKALNSVNAIVIESTLSGKTLRHRIRDAKNHGFLVTIVFVLLESADACVDRVAERHKKGGHNVPESDIRRRYGRSLVNFWQIYRELSDHWLIANNSGRVPVDVAIGTADTISIRDTAHFDLFKRLVDEFK